MCSLFVALLCLVLATPVAQQDISKNILVAQSSDMIGWGCFWFDELLDGGGIGIWAVNTQGQRVRCVVARGVGGRGRLGM